MPGAKMVRFPDVKTPASTSPARPPWFICHNGNRGFETCAALAAMGIDCRFLIGGLEKWLVEKRPLTGLNARTLADLRAVPAHRNQSSLLDTTQVRELLEKDNAVFVDTRYPGEFASGHLPNAINLPIRPTPTAELKAKIAQLPKQPIVVPCYDRRSLLLRRGARPRARTGRLRLSRPLHHAVGVLLADRAAPLHQGVARRGQQGLLPEGRRVRWPACCRRSPARIGLLLDDRPAGLSVAAVDPAVRGQGRARPDHGARSIAPRWTTSRQRFKDDPVAQVARHPRLLPASRHDAGPQSHRHAVPADHGGGIAGGAGPCRHEQCRPALDRESFGSRSLAGSADRLRPVDYGLSRSCFRDVAR